MKLPIGGQFEHVVASFKDADGGVKPGHGEKATAVLSANMWYKLARRMGACR